MDCRQTLLPRRRTLGVRLGRLWATLLRTPCLEYFLRDLTNLPLRALERLRELWEDTGVALCQKPKRLNLSLRDCGEA